MAFHNVELQISDLALSNDDPPVEAPPPPSTGTPTFHHIVDYVLSICSCSWLGNLLFRIHGMCAMRGLAHIQWKLPAADFI